MDFTFDFGWMVAGLAITAVSGAVVIFYRQIADNLANGVSSYDRVKLFGIIGVVVGLIVTMNLHTLILTFVFRLVGGGI